MRYLRSALVSFVLVGLDFDELVLLQLKLDFALLVMPHSSCPLFSTPFTCYFVRYLVRFLIPALFEIRFAHLFARLLGYDSG